jgi:hypothetical protein
MSGTVAEKIINEHIVEGEITPGFDAVFTISGLLAVAYLKKEKKIERQQPFYLRSPLQLLCRKNKIK